MTHNKTPKPAARRTALALWTAGAVSALLAPYGARAQTYPDRPITLVVPYAAGGPTDQHIRAMANEVSKVLGQPLVIDNRVGANGTNGASTLSRANPDGYTLAILPASVYREPYINKVTYDPSAFSYVILLSDYTFGLAIKADAPWKTWRDFVADAAKRPHQINVGAAGAIGTPRIVMEEIGAAANIDLNTVPYKGDADIATAILGGHLDAAPLSGVATPHIDTGKMRYLVMLTERRVKHYPDLPTLKELGINAWIDSPYGLAGPKGMDPARVKLVHDAFKKALESSASVKVMDMLNQQPNYMGPDDYRQYALQSLAREKVRVARLRQKGLIN